MDATSIYETPRERERNMYLYDRCPLFIALVKFSVPSDFNVEPKPNISFNSLLPQIQQTKNTIILRHCLSSARLVQVWISRTVVLNTHFDGHTLTNQNSKNYKAVDNNNLDWSNVISNGDTKFFKTVF